MSYGQTGQQRRSAVSQRSAAPPSFRPASLLLLKLFLSTLVLSILAAAAAVGAEARPNIVVIMADDMGFSDIGCYGSEIATPNIDRLAAEGMRFAQFYNTSRCCPT